MPSLSSLTTFSGLLVLLGTLGLLWSRPLIAGVTFTVAGAGGTAIFWDRWSRLSGNQVHVTAFLRPEAPSGGDAAMLATHLPLLIIGVAILVLVYRVRVKA